MDKINQIIMENEEDKVSSSAELKQMLETNIALSQEILDLAVYIKNYIVWQKIFSYLKLLIIVVPIVLAFIYLPPFFKDSYQSLLQGLNELKALNQ